MKVRTFDTERRYARLELSRRNLLALLAKLDQNLEEAQRAADSGGPMKLANLSRCTLISPLMAETEDGPEPLPVIEVVAVEDFVHYTDREPGPMAPATEERMLRARD